MYVRLRFNGEPNNNVVDGDGKFIYQFHDGFASISFSLYIFNNFVLIRRGKITGEKNVQKRSKK